LESSWRLTPVWKGFNQWIVLSSSIKHPAIELGSYWQTVAFEDWYVSNYLFLGQPVVWKIPADTLYGFTLGPRLAPHFPYGIPVEPDAPL